MTSIKQIEANRRNALKSTGPRTEDGKQNASRNAIRHGLTAETVLEPLEDPEDYKAFEQAVAADYDAQSAVERELILRISSLLWRLRRATSIETGLMSMEDENLGERKQSPETPCRATDNALSTLFRLGKRPPRESVTDAWNNRRGNGQASENDAGADVHRHSVAPVLAAQSAVAGRFLRITNLDNAVFERLNRYEMTLWRQVRQTIFTLEAMRWRNLTPRRPNRLPWRND